MNMTRLGISSDWAGNVVRLFVFQCIAVKPSVHSSNFTQTFALTRCEPSPNKDQIQCQIQSNLEGGLVVGARIHSLLSY